MSQSVCLSLSHLLCFCGFLFLWMSHSLSVSNFICSIFCSVSVSRSLSLCRVSIYIFVSPFLLFLSFIFMSNLSVLLIISLHVLLLSLFSSSSPYSPIPSLPLLLLSYSPSPLPVLLQRSQFFFSSPRYSF